MSKKQNKVFTKEVQRLNIWFSRCSNVGAILYVNKGGVCLRSSLRRGAADFGALYRARIQGIVRQDNMSKSRVDTAPCRDREAVCFGGIASPHYSIYKRELAKKERSRGRKAVTVALALVTAALFTAAVGSVVHLLRYSGGVGLLSGTVLGMGESESGADSVGDMLVRARETAKKERTASGGEIDTGTAEQKLETLTGIDFTPVTAAWSKVYNIPRGLAVQEVETSNQVGGVHLRVGDVVTSINGVSVFGTDEAYSVISAMQSIGKCRAELSFYRNGVSYIAVFVFQ